MPVANEHVARGAGGCGFASVDGEDLPVGGADEDETSAADARVVPVHDAERQRRRDRGVDGIAAVAQHLCPRAGGEGMNGHDHPARRAGGVAR
jgi:hypothetical protein